jgi:hypothetical protein
MSQVSNINQITPHHNYFVRLDRDDNPKLSRCYPPGGYPTVVAAKQAEIYEIQDEIRFHLEMISGFLKDIERSKEKRGHMRPYISINLLLNEIEKATTHQENVRMLKLDDTSRQGKELS